MQSFARFKILTKLVTENAATILFLCDNLLVEYKLFEHLFCLFSLLVGFFFLGVISGQKIMLDTPGYGVTC